MALFFALSLKSTVFKAARARLLRLPNLTLAILSGSRTFSSTVSFGFMKNCWKTKPKVSPRSLLILRLESFEESSPFMKTLPLVGVSRRASKCIKVDLPEPDLPMMATDSPS